MGDSTAASLKPYLLAERAALLCSGSAWQEEPQGKTGQSSMTHRQPLGGPSDLSFKPLAGQLSLARTLKWERVRFLCLLWLVPQLPF